MELAKGLQDLKPQLRLGVVDEAEQSPRQFRLAGAQLAKHAGGGAAQLHGMSGFQQSKELLACCVKHTGQARLAGAVWWLRARLHDGADRTPQLSIQGRGLDSTPNPAASWILLRDIRRRRRARDRHNAVALWGRRQRRHQVLRRQVRRHQQPRIYRRNRRWTTAPAERNFAVGHRSNIAATCVGAWRMAAKVRTKARAATAAHRPEPEGYHGKRGQTQAEHGSFLFPGRERSSDGKRVVRKTGQLSAF